MSWLVRTVTFEHDFDHFVGGVRLVAAGNVGDSVTGVYFSVSVGKNHISFMPKLWNAGDDEGIIRAVTSGRTLASHSFSSAHGNLRRRLRLLFAVWDEEDRAKLTKQPAVKEDSDQGNQCVQTYTRLQPAAIPPAGDVSRVAFTQACSEGPRGKYCHHPL